MSSVFSSYKLLPHLPSPSPSPSAPELNSIDEYSELDTSNYYYSQSDSGWTSYSHCSPITKKKKKLLTFHQDEFDPYMFVDCNINVNNDSNDTSTDFCAERSDENYYEWDFKDKQQEQERSKQSLPEESLFSVTSIKSSNVAEIDVQTILCDSLQHCPSMHRITQHLQTYQLIENDIIDDIDFMMKMNEFIIDDYHHILIQHLSHKHIGHINEEFNLLNHELNKKIYCNVDKCSSIKRYHRIRENIPSQIIRSPELQFYIDLMDTIHCYFIHSFHLGMRVKLNKYYNSNDFMECKYTATELDCYDQQIKTIKRRLNQLNITRNRNRFFTTLTNPDNTAQYAKSYSFGHKYYYWDEFKYNNEHDHGPNKGYLKRDWYIKKKYDSIKQEILQNSIYSLDLIIFNITMDKAERLLLSQTAKQMKSDNSVFSEFAKIKPYSSLSINNILCVLLYCDYSELSYFFTSTFRRINANEMNKDLKNRNREYWNESKYLTETVELFGDNICFGNDINIYYHGISYMLFDSMIAHFCGPTSTTNTLTVATVFALQNNNGIILELVGENVFSSLKAFNCEWLSSFGNENERLFFGGRRALKFHNIHVIKENEDYFWFVKALRLFDCIISGKKLNEYEVECAGYHDQYILPWDYQNIYQLINGQVSDVPMYIQMLFKCFCLNKKAICIDLDIINNQFYAIKTYLFYEQNSLMNLLKINSLCELFKNCEEIMISGVGNMSFAFVKELISMMNQLHDLKHCNLEKISLFNVLYNNMVLDKLMFDETKFNKLNEWAFEVDVKYRTEFESKGVLKIPETSNLIINKRINIENEFVFDLLNTDEDYNDESQEDSESLVHIDNNLVDELWDRIETIQ